MIVYTQPQPFCTGSGQVLVKQYRFFYPTRVHRSIDVPQTARGTIASLRPVSACLEAELRARVGKHGIVVWLDRHDRYSGVVCRLRALRDAGRLPYAVHAFDGSYLELMLALEGVAAGSEKPPLVLHLPGFNLETVRAGPLLGWHALGHEFRKALDTLVAESAAGRVAPDEIAAFVSRGGLTLDQADRWLDGHLTGRDTGVAGQLERLGLDGVIDWLLDGASELPVEPLWGRLQAWTGIRQDWVEAGADLDKRQEIAFAVASWTLCVEYVHDLARHPVSEVLAGMRDLPGAVVEGCCALAARLRRERQRFYESTADATEARLVEEVQTAAGPDLGRIDTFRFEERTLLDAALAALDQEDWEAAQGWADQRLEADSFWLRDELRRSQWQLVKDAARLGETMREAGPSPGTPVDLDQFVARYAELGAPVDRAHRHLEQRRDALLKPDLPEFEALRERLDLMRVRWRGWADGWATGFNQVCRGQGFLPPAMLQQRTLFDEVVRPMCRESGATALLMIDALRFEMAQELFEALRSATPATSAHLRPRLAELPTVTSVGMNVLAPVSERGQLRPVLAGGKITGFSVGDYRVTAPSTRKRAMADRVGGECAMWRLDEVLSRSRASLMQAVSRARLFIVHSQEIDSAGEKEVGPRLFEGLLIDLRAAWKLLRQAGVRRFIITADHGYLLLLDPRPPQAHGRKIDPARRHILTPDAADRPDEVRVPLAKLGYADCDLHLVCPDSTAAFDTGGRTAQYVHGGNSPQERVIPVLTLVHRAPAGEGLLHYAVEARRGEPQGGMHRIDARVVLAAQGALDFGSRETIELALRAIDAPQVQVDVCDVRGGARLEAGSIIASCEQSFAVIFRLAGADDVRVQVELHHPTAAELVAPCVVDGRFAVAASRAPATKRHEQQAAALAPAAWLEELPEAARKLFAHLAAHGTLTEAEVVRMLGGTRAARRFAREFDSHVAHAPFAVRIDVVAGVKRYVREGSAR